jgi:cyanophycinase
VVVTLFILLLAGNILAQAKGHLLIIGGGERTDEIMKRFVELAGGEKARIVVFPMASGYAESVGVRQSEQIKTFGVRHSFSLNIDRTMADNDSVVRLLENVTGVFFSGGDQSKLTAALKNTKAEKRIHEIYARGGVIGGTSAGAAVMSKIMLTGEELINKDSTSAYFTIAKGNIETKEGFGFVTEAIIDQHFIVRKRHNRLITLILENPSLLGVGIDESTCIIVNPDRTFSVLGESVVIVYDARKAKNLAVTKNGYLAGEGLVMSVLKSGDTFNLRQAGRK